MTRPVTSTLKRVYYIVCNHRAKVVKLKTFDSFLCPFRTQSDQIEHIIQRDKTNLLGTVLKMLDV